MKSIRTKITAVVAVIFAFVTITLLLIFMVSFRAMSKRDSNQILEHIGRENANNLDMILQNVTHSVGNIYYYSNDQMESLFGKLYGQNFREEYLEKVSMLALSEANGSDYIKSIYYQLVTSIDTPNGFRYNWNEEKDIFDKVSPTVISDYDKGDIEHVGWYWLPKEKKEAVWLGPYQSESLGTRVISYAAPVYVYGRFASVIGVDIDVNVLCRGLREVKVYDTGSVILFDAEGDIVYSRDNEDGLAQEAFSDEENKLFYAMRDSLADAEPVEYRTKTGNKKLYACQLTNGMTVCVTAPRREIYRMSATVLSYSILAALILLIVTFIVMFLVINVFLKPLKELTEAARQLEDGDFEVHLHYWGNDEIGQLSKTFGLMANSLKKYFDHFHSLAYTDSLTGLNNKAAYTITKDVIESEVKMGRASFTILVMDVNNLKIINDSIGHEKGDLLLQHVTQCLRKALVGFPIYRIGGDEFCSIVNNTDPELLIERLQGFTSDMSRKDMEIFHCTYQVAAGAATYQKGQDKEFDDVFNRADQAMYENKKYLKSLDPPAYNDKQL